MTTFKDSKDDVINPRLNMREEPLQFNPITTAVRDALPDVTPGAVIFNGSTLKFQGLVSVGPQVWEDFN